MRRNLFGAFVLTILSLGAFAQGKTAKKAGTTTAVTSGYNIPVTIAPYKNTWLYLGCYYGKYKNLADSAFLDDKGHGVFKGKEKLPKGIYFAVSPAKYLLFEFLIDDAQNFTIKADTTKLSDYQVIGSHENDLFLNYTRFLSKKAPALTQLQSQLASAKTAADSAAIKENLKKANKELDDYRDNITKTEPKSMLSVYFATMKRPEAPKVPVINGKPDSTYPYRYVKQHYWDDVPFNDESLVRTPFFDPKLDEYYKYYVVPDVDSVISEVDYMLIMARENRPMFQFLLGKFTDKFINPEYMGQEKVFLHLFDKYYSKGDTAWLNEKARKTIFERAYSMMANQLNEVAADMQMLDTSNNPVTLHTVSSPYTFLVFWDPNCGHCKETVPRIDSIYRAKWKGLGVKIVGVNVDEAANTAWKKFIKEHDLQGWVNMYQEKSAKEDETKRGVPNYRQLYDVYKTPTLYLLDSQKRIIGKMLSIEQFDEVLQAKIKKSKNNPDK